MSLLAGTAKVISLDHRVEACAGRLSDEGGWKLPPDLALNGGGIHVEIRESQRQVDKGDLSPAQSVT